MGAVANNTSSGENNNNGVIIIGQNDTSTMPSDILNVNVTDEQINEAVQQLINGTFNFSNAVNSSGSQGESTTSGSGTGNVTAYNESAVQLTEEFSCDQIMTIVSAASNEDTAADF